MTSSPRVYKLNLQPGDKVRYIKDGFLSNDPDIGVSLSATRGSTATVVSEQEYQAWIKHNRNKSTYMDYIPRTDLDSKGRVNTYIHYPIRLERIPPVDRSWKYVIHKQGDIILECVDALEKLHPLTPELTLVLDSVRQIMPDDEAFFRRQPHDRLLVIGFHIENPTKCELHDRLHAEAWLTHVDTQVKSSSLYARSVIQGAERIQGQVIFEIPREQQCFRFKLELSGLGSVETDLYIQDLVPGDSICLKGTASAEWYDYFLASRPYDEYPLVDPFFIPSSKSIPAGSKGVIIPFARFRAAYIRHLQRLGPDLVSENLAAIEIACDRVKRDMEDGIAYPIEMTNLAPIPAGMAEDEWERKYFNLRAGTMLVVNSLALKKEAAVLEPILAVHWVRILLPTDDHPLRHEVGAKRLLIDFSFDRLDGAGLSDPVEFWLAAGSGKDGQTLLKPARLEVYQPASPEGLSGQIAFDVPPEPDVFVLHLKVTDGCEWQQSLELPVFQPGERIQLAHQFFGGDGPEPTYLAGCKGRVLTYYEYLAELSRQGLKLDEDQRIYVERWLALEQPDQADGKSDKYMEFPVRFEEAPSSRSGHGTAGQDDRIHWLNAYFLAKLK